MQASSGVCGALAGLSLLVAGCGDDVGSSGGGEPGSGSIVVQISGEDIAIDGFSFPEGSEVTFADGWEIRFDHVFVTVGRVWLSESPDQNPGDQSQTGAEVAEVVGPWAIDLSREGEEPGAGGEGTATRLAVIENQNLNDDAGFVADQRYAFGFSFVEPSSAATRVNFDDDADAVAAYQEAIDAGYVVYYVGTATFRGTTCESSDDSYDFAAIPETFPVKLGFTTPTSYLNCQNQENQGDPFSDEEYQRGIPIKASGASLAQITVHLEHPFYSDVEHEPALYFDQLAAQLVGSAADEALTIDLLEGVDPTGFTDGAGADLPWRVCDGSTLPSPAQRAFDTGSIPVGPGQDPSDGIRDYRDYASYVQSTMGHLNGGEGLCYIQRNYASPN